MPPVALERQAANAPSERSIMKNRIPVGLPKCGVMSVPLGGNLTSMTSSTPSLESISAARSGLYAYAFNSYQSVIRGGHIWLRLRIGQEKVLSQGDHLNALIALNQDSIERHAPEVESGGAILFNADKLRVNLPIREVNDLASLFTPGQGLVRLGQGLDRLYPIDKNNFGPRAGIAWDVNGDGRTSVRAGYALTYDLPDFKTIHSPTRHGAAWRRAPVR